MAIPDKYSIFEKNYTKYKSKFEAGKLYKKVLDVNAFEFFLDNGEVFYPDAGYHVLLQNDTFIPIELLRDMGPVNHLYTTARDLGWVLMKIIYRGKIGYAAAAILDESEIVNE